MSIEEMETALVVDEVYFTYYDKEYAIELTVENYDYTYHFYSAVEETLYHSYEKLISDKIFDGKSLKEIFDDIEIEFL